MLHNTCESRTLQFVGIVTQADMETGLEISSALMPAFRRRMSARTDEFDKMLSTALSKNTNTKSRTPEIDE